MLVKDFIKWAESMQKEEHRIMLDKGKEYTKQTGQRLMTITGLLKKGTPNKVTIKFPKLKLAIQKFQQFL